MYYVGAILIRSLVPALATDTNTTPTISPIGYQLITINTSTEPISFTVADAETPASSLTLSVESSNTSIVPTGNIVFGGSGASRTVTITPATNQTGSATITVTVSDGGAHASTSFDVAVNPAVNLAEALIAADIGSSNFVYVTSEAEAGTLVSPMQVTTNPSASKGAYVSSPLGGQGSVMFAVNVPVADTYVIWCRVVGSSTSNASFFVSVDGGIIMAYDVAEGTWSENWQWTMVNGRAGGQPLALNPRTFTLSSGLHQIVFRARSENTLLDRLIITNDREITFGDAITP